MKIDEIHKSAMELPDSARASLAADLLGSLPAVLVEEDDGAGEAERRSREMDSDPSVGLSWSEMKQSLGR